MRTYFKSEAIVNTGSTFAYKGNGYRYFLRKTGRGLTASLQVPKVLMERFVQRVGVCNSIGLPKVVVFQTGGGWWKITTLEDMDASIVTKFLARFNRWVLKNAQPTQSPFTVQVVADNLLHRHYTVAATVHEHTSVNKPDLQLLANHWAAARHSQGRSYGTH